MKALSLVLLMTLCDADAADTPWRVGLAYERITPQQPIAMSGYGPRVSEGVLDDLYAKAMLIEDRDQQRALLVTADLLFFRAPLAEALCVQIAKATGLKRHEILLNASHTHAGPVFGIKDPDRFGLGEEQKRSVESYTQALRSLIVQLAVSTMDDLRPACLSWGVGNAGEFVMNRRFIDETGKYRGMRPNPKGSADRDVPVLCVKGPNGQVRAVVFGCACHPVTLDGNNRKLSGDFAGSAQQYIQRQHAGAQAMFVIGCGADANSNPRGGPDQEKLVRQHGETLGREVCRVVSDSMQPVGGPLQVFLKWTDLPLQDSFTIEELERIAEGSSFWHARNAKGLLEILSRGESLPQHYRAAISLWRFGDDLTLVGLPGEAVADYTTMLRKALGPQRLWIAAYSNESFGYLPTAKVLSEGGHETIGLTLDVGLFSPEVEGVVIDTVQELAKRAGRSLDPDYSP